MGKRVCFVATAEMSVKAFLLPSIRRLEETCDITVVTNTTREDFLRVLGLRAKTVPVRIERKINLGADGAAFLRLSSLFRRERFDLIHSIMPKSGLLAMAAARLNGIPLRVHTFTGQYWATRRGLWQFYKVMDRLIAACATHILVDSRSQREFIVKEGVVGPEKATVIAEGSICGVDTDRFAPNPVAREELRRHYGLSGKDVLFLYLGRLNYDKGLLDLARAFAKVARRRVEAKLMLVGPDEAGIAGEIGRVGGDVAGGIRYEGFTDSPEQFMAAADVFCLPSYREGFGIVIVEAGACGIPSIGSRIYGISDTIDDGVTGLLFTPGDVDDLAAKMEGLIDLPDRRREMGMKAREDAGRRFSRDRVESFMADYYRNLLRGLA